MGVAIVERSYIKTGRFQYNSEDKKKKVREVELWNRSLREEEKIAIEKYAKQHGDKEMDQIQKAIEEKQKKEQEDREILSKAIPAFE